MTELTRFYQTFQPEHYAVFLDIDRKAKWITGKTSITGDAKAETISVHQKGLVIDTVQVEDQDVPFTVDTKNDAVHITLAQTGEIAVTITYKAALTDTMMGIYPSYYELNGVKKQIICASGFSLH
jgi:aminopeptidase N